MSARLVVRRGGQAVTLTARLTCGGIGWQSPWAGEAGRSPALTRNRRPRSWGEPGYPRAARAPTTTVEVRGAEPGHTARHRPLASAVNPRCAGGVHVPAVARTRPVPSHLQEDVCPPSVR